MFVIWWNFVKILISDLIAKPISATCEKPFVIFSSFLTEEEIKINIMVKKKKTKNWQLTISNAYKSTKTHIIVKLVYSLLY